MQPGWEVACGAPQDDRAFVLSARRGAAYGGNALEAYLMNRWLAHVRNATLATNEAAQKERLMRARELQVLMRELFAPLNEPVNSEPM